MALRGVGLPCWRTTSHNRSFGWLAEATLGRLSTAQ